MAIEGGNFTTAFFKEQTIQELFTEPSGLESFANELSKKEKLKEIVTEKSEETKAGGDTVEETPVPSEKNIMAQFEKVGNLRNTMFWRFLKVSPWHIGLLLNMMTLITVW